MPNGMPPDPNALAITVTGRPNQPTTWRTAPIPPSHGPNSGYWISEADRTRIHEIVDQQLAPLVLNAPRANPPAEVEAGVQGHSLEGQAIGDAPPQGRIQQGGPLPGSP